MAATKTHVQVQYQSSSDSESEQSADSEFSEEENLENEEVTIGAKPQGKSGMADVMAKILGKQVPEHKVAILAKGSTDRVLKKRRATKEKEVENAEKKGDKVTGSGSETLHEQLASKEKKKVWEAMGRLKPSPLEIEKERQLQKIATRGVVQLFNAVRKQQKLVEEKLNEAGPSERKKAKAVETMTKGNFLDLLKGTTANVKAEPVGTTDKQRNKKGHSLEASSTEQSDSKWSILKDDFMMGAKMKDWDKESSGDESGMEQEDVDLSDDSGE